MTSDWRSGPCVIYLPHCCSPGDYWPGHPIEYGGHENVQSLRATDFNRDRSQTSSVDGFTSYGLHPGSHCGRLRAGVRIGGPDHGTVS
jgi:hypothetical protein